MRDDSILVTGMTSQSFASPKVRELNGKRRLKRDEVREKKTRLQPAGELVISQLDQEINRIIYEPYPGEDNMTDTEFRAERRARRLTVERLTAVKVRLGNILRDHDAPKTWEETVGD